MKKFFLDLLEVFSMGNEENYDYTPSIFNFSNKILWFSGFMFFFGVAFLLVMLPITESIPQAYYVFISILLISYIIFKLGVVLKLVNYLFELIPYGEKPLHWTNKCLSFVLFIMCFMILNMSYGLIFGTVTHNMVHSDKYDLEDYDFKKYEEQYIEWYEAFWTLEELLINISTIIICVVIVFSVFKWFILREKKKEDEEFETDED